MTHHEARDLIVGRGRSRAQIHVNPPADFRLNGVLDLEDVKRPIQPMDYIRRHLLRRAERPPALAPLAVQRVFAARTRRVEFAVDLDAEETLAGVKMILGRAGGSRSS
jgi:hypothetical protein